MRANVALPVISLAAVIFAGSCAPPIPVTNPAMFADGAVNHPITVEPSYRSLKVAPSGPDGGLSAEDSAQLSIFVSEYLASGNGALTVSAPRGSGSSEAIRRVGERVIAMGVPGTKLLVGTRDATAGDAAVELGYVTYAAHTTPCTNWTQDADETEDNLPMPDFGCAVQHNIAAMVADPRDLVQPRTMGPSDAARRATLTKQYETGQTTSAQKTQDQSGAVSAAKSGGGG